jgi:hypothetical protein
VARHTAAFVRGLQRAGTVAAAGRPALAVEVTERALRASGRLIYVGAGPPGQAGRAGRRPRRRDHEQTSVAPPPRARTSPWSWGDGPGRTHGPW